jgi:PAS domain S-box-containing protein
MRLIRLFGTLKFRIIMLAAAASALTAIVVTSGVLRVTQGELERQLLDSERLDRERTAALLGSKLETLKDSLKAVAQQAGPHLWRDREAMASFLLDKPGLSALFDGVLAATPDGTMLARVERGKRAAELPNIADRDYFQRVMRGDQPVVSEPLLGKVSKRAIVIVAVPVVDHKGTVHGTIAGALRLQSNSLFADPITRRNDAVRDFVIDRQGTLLSHTDTQRVMGRAADEPGFTDAFGRWHGSGSPIDTAASAELSQDNLVSMVGIPLSDWLLVRVTPRSVAMASMAAAQRAAWAAAAAAGLASALIAGVVAWAAARPIGLLRDRAERLLAGGTSEADEWPRQGGEIGAMSRAFQRLLQTRELQRAELQAVLDNADVGLALSRDGRFEMVSRQFCTIFGFDPAQIIGQPTRMLHASDASYAALSERAHPAFLQHGLFDGEVELVRASGQAFWARMRGRAIVPGDRSIGTIWVIADVTQDHDQRERLHWATTG